MKKRVVVRDQLGGDWTFAADGQPLTMAWTVGEFKALLQQRLPTQPRPDQQRLICAGRILSDDSWSLAQVEGLLLRGSGTSGTCGGSVPAELESESAVESAVVEERPLVLHLLVRTPGSLGTMPTTATSTTTTTTTGTTTTGTTTLTQATQTATSATASSTSTHHIWMGIPGLSAPILVVDGMPYLIVPGGGAAASFSPAAASSSSPTARIFVRAQGVPGIMPAGGGGGGAPVRLAQRHAAHPPHAPPGERPRVALFRLQARDVQTIFQGLWTLAKYAFFVYIFSLGASFERLVFMHLLALTLYLVQSGTFNGLLANIRERIQRYNEAQVQGQGQDGNQQVDGGGRVPGRAFFQSAAYMLLSFLGTLVPGVEEMLVPQPAAEQERVNQENPPAVAVQENPPAPATEEPQVSATEELQASTTEEPQVTSPPPPSTPSSSTTTKIPTTTIIAEGRGGRDGSSTSSAYQPSSNTVQRKPFLATTSGSSSAETQSTSSDD